MRILVTGAEGFVGRHLLQALAREGTHQVLAGSWSGSFPTLEVTGAPDVETVQLDITSEESVRSAIREHRPEWVFHLARAPSAVPSPIPWAPGRSTRPERCVWSRRCDPTGGGARG